MDGFDVLVALKSNEDTRQIPVIVITTSILRKILFALTNWERTLILSIPSQGLS